MSLRTRQTLLALSVSGALAAAGVVATTLVGGTEEASASSCAPGFTPVDRVLDEVRHEMAREGEDAAVQDNDEEAQEELAREAVKELPMLADVPTDEWSNKCVRSQRPESLQEQLALFGARAIPAWRLTGRTPMARP